MKKKAFTLIELLAIMVVLAGIFIMVVPEIKRVLENRKIKEFNELATTIQNAARLYVSENYKIGVDTIPGYLTLGDLTGEELLDAPVVDPRSGSEFNSDTLITISTDSDGVLVYTFDDGNLVPNVATATIVSNNSLNNKYAKNGNTVTLSIEFNKNIVNTPTITIGGRAATVTGSGKTRTATYTIASNESTLSEGALALSISNYIDSGNIIGNTVTSITSGGNVTYDRTIPGINTFYIGGAGNPAYINTTNTILYSDVTGATQMCVNISSSSCSTWEAYSSSLAYTLSSGDGIKTIYVWYRDAAGNTTNVYSDSITLDTALPSVAYFYIGGAGNPAYTNTATVNVYSSASDASSGISQMCVGTSSLSCSTWVPYANTYAYPSSLGTDGTKTLYGWFRDTAGNSITVNDSIILDTLAPTGSIVTNSGATYATTTSASLTISATDGSSGLSQMCISTSSSSCNGTWETYATSKSYTLASGDGTKPLYIWFKDVAGNINSTYAGSDSIVLDTTPPTGSIVINSGSTYTTSTSVSLTLSAADATSGVSQMCISTSSSSCNGTWEAYATSKSYTLASGDGTKTLYVWFMDNAGNPDSTYAGSDSITLDSTPPSGTLLMNSGATYTTSQSVTLTISASDALTSVSQMCVSNTTSCSSWETYATSKSWALTAGDGTKTVYIWFKDALGNAPSSPSTSDTIIYNSAAPVFSYFRIGGSAAPSGPYYGITSLTTTFYSNVDDATQMCFSTNSSSCDGSWIAYADTSTQNLTGSVNSTITRYAFYKDDTGDPTHTIGPYGDDVRYLQATHTHTYYTLASGYSYAETSSWVVNTSTVIQGSPSSGNSNYWGIMYYGELSGQASDFRVRGAYDNYKDYDISSITYTINNNESGDGTTKQSWLYVGGPCPALSYTNSTTYSFASGKPTALSTYMVSNSPGGTNPAVWTITDSTWIGKLVNANADCLYINRGDTSNYWEGYGSKTSGKPSMVITWVPRSQPTN